MTGAEFASAARTMLGTPFHHQGRVPGIGLDCAGLAVCAAAQCGHTISDRSGYGRIPAHNLFAQCIAEQCDPIALPDVRPGDLLSFAFRLEPQHVAIVTAIDPVMLIHALKDAKRVVENSLDATWQGRLRGVWRLRGMT